MMAARSKSEDVTAWGKRWLAAWIREAENDDARLVREDVAAHWQAYSLEDWLRGATRPSTAELAARLNAGNHWALYRREQHGLLVWRAFREYRSAGLPVPEHILARLDEMGRRLESASGAAEVAQAVEMSGKGGGPQGAAHITAVERQRRIVSAVEQLIAHGMAPTAAMHRVDAEFGLTPGASKWARIRWRKAARKPARPSAAADILRMLGKR